MKNAVNIGAVHTYNLIDNVGAGLVPALCKVLYALQINIETD